MYEVEIIDIYLISYFIGVEIIHKEDEIVICQRKYVIEHPGKFYMDDCNRIRIPLEVRTKLSTESDAGLFIHISYYYCIWIKHDFS